MSAIESMPKYIPEIQDQLRHKNFPRFTEDEIRNVRVSLDAPPTVTTMPRYEFQDKARRAGIVVTKDSVALHVSLYNSFDEFCSSLQVGLEIVDSVADLGLVERVGLRYVDLIRPGFHETLSDYLEQGLLGLDETKVGATRSMLRFQMLGETDHGTLAVRLYQRADGSFLPPDLDPSPLDQPAPEPKLAPDEKVTLLDIDHYNELQKTPMEFSVEAVMSLLWRVHDNADLAFRAAVTEHALTEWGRT